MPHIAYYNNCECWCEAHTLRPWAVVEARRERVTRERRRFLLAVGRDARCPFVAAALSLCPSLPAQQSRAGVALGVPARRLPAPLQARGERIAPLPAARRPLRSLRGGAVYYLWGATRPRLVVHAAARTRAPSSTLVMRGGWVEQREGGESGAPPPTAAATPPVSGCLLPSLLPLGALSPHLPWGGRA